MAMPSRLLRRDGKAPSLSVVSIALIAAGGAALALSVLIISVYFLHVRRARRRRLEDKASDPMTAKVGQRAGVDAGLPVVTPAMRLVQSTREADIEAMRRASAYRANMIQPMSLPQQVQMIPRQSFSSHHSSSTGPYPPSSSSGTQGISSGDYVQPPSMARIPPLPADSQFRLQLARQEQLTTAPAKAVVVSTPSSTPVHARDQNKTRSTVPSALIKGLGDLPQLSIPTNTNAASSTTLRSSPKDRIDPLSLSPNLARSDDGSESYTPVLDLGLEFDKTRAHSSPFEIDHSVMEQSSWLASMLDSSFEGQASFKEPPRRAPPAPARKSIVPPPACNPPTPPITVSTKMVEQPQTGRPARVTVDYYSPYRQRSLYQQNPQPSEQEPIELISSTQHIYVPSVEQIAQAAARSTGIQRNSVEPSLRAAALFSSMEPALRNEGHSLDMSASAHTTGMDSSTMQDRSFSQDGNSTANTSVHDAEASRYSNSSDFKRIPIVPVDYIESSPELSIQSPVLRTGALRPATVLPTLTTAGALIRECQEAIGINSRDHSDVSLVKGEEKTATPATFTSSKSGFASNLRARMSMGRLKSTGSASSSSPNLSQNSPRLASPPMLSPRLPMIEGLSPALSGLSAAEGTPNSFGPPTETWNVSTDDIAAPPFVRSSMLATDGQTLGLGLRSGNDAGSMSRISVDPTHHKRTISKTSQSPQRLRRKPSRSSASTHVKQPSVNLDRNNSVSSYGSSRPSHERTQAFPWSRHMGPSAVQELHPYSPYVEELQNGATSPRFADADSPNASPPRFITSAGHTTADHSLGHVTSQRCGLGEGQWTLDRSRTVRDSIASSYCDTIRSSMTGNSDGNAAFDYENAQSQRAKLLQSVQKRQHAKQVEKPGWHQPGQAASSFTSHSATLSAEMKEEHSSMRSNTAAMMDRRLDINVGAPFSAEGSGILTPPLTPFEKKVALPDLERATVVTDSVAPSHARRARPTQASHAGSTSENDRQAERLSKLRPLSLATLHNQPLSHSGVPNAPLPPLQMSHRYNSSRNSSALGLSPSTSFGSALGVSSGPISPTRPLFLAQYNSSTAMKRTSRASSNNGSILQGPMGAINGPGLSTTVSPHMTTTTLIGVLPTLSAESSPSFLPSSHTSTPKVTSAAPTVMSTRKPSFSTATAPNMLSAQQAWLATGAPSDGRASPSAGSARLSGSSFASHTSLLARFPALHPATGVAMHTGMSS